MNAQLLVLRPKADRRRTVAAPTDVTHCAALERTLVAGYDATSLVLSFNEWVSTVAADEAHPYHDAAAEYCELWRRHMVH